jgi:hypothetical protein
LTEIGLLEKEVCPSKVSDSFFGSKEGLAEWKAQSFEGNELGERYCNCFTSLDISYGM